MELSDDSAGRLVQLQEIKQDVIDNHNSVFDQSTADAMNADSLTGYLVYKPKVTRSEILLNGFDWTRLDNLSVGKARVWDAITTVDAINGSPGFNPAKSNVRAGINEVWSGPAQDLAVRAVIYSHSSRTATIAEQLLASGLGTAPDSDGAGPGVLGDGASGLITNDNLIEADGVTLP